jgi:hypothetical protein
MSPESVQRYRIQLVREDGLAVRVVVTRDDQGAPAKPPKRQRLEELNFSLYACTRDTPGSYRITLPNGVAAASGSAFQDSNSAPPSARYASYRVASNPDGDYIVEVAAKDATHYALGFCPRFDEGFANSSYLW